MIFDFDFVFTIVLIIFLSRLLPFVLRHDLLSIVGFIVLLLYAPLIAWILVGALICVIFFWLKKRQRLNFFYLLIIVFWAYAYNYIPETPFLFTQFLEWHFFRYNIQRIIHLGFEDKRNKMQTSTLRSLFHYTFYIPLLFGTIEWFHDFYSPFKKKQTPIYYKEACLNFLKAAFFAYLSFFLNTYFVFNYWDYDLLFNTTSPLPVLLYGSSIGIAIYFILVSNFAFARGLAALSGYKLERRLFGSIFKARSVIEFWSNWNIPNIVFIREYLFIPLLTFFANNWKRTLIVASIIFWIVMAYLHSTILWAFLNASAIYIQILWTKFRASNPKVKTIYDQYCPLFLRRFITITFIATTSVLLIDGSVERFFYFIYILFDRLIMAYLEVQNIVFNFIFNLISSSLGI